MQERHPSSGATQRPAPGGRPRPSDGPPRVVGRFAIGLTIYFGLITVYVFALRRLSEPLVNLYDSRMVVYTIVALFLILTQGIALEWVTAMLAEHVGIVTREE